MRQSSSNADSTSLSLLQRVRARDSQAWETLTRLYGPLVFRWCKRRGLQDNDAADVVQEVFGAGYSSLDGFRRDRSGDTFRGWLWTITERKLIDHFREGSREPAGVGGSTARNWLQVFPDASPPESQTTHASDAALFVRRILQLVRGDFTEKTWNAFSEVVLKGRPPRDIAAEFGMSENSVHQAKSRVLARIREELEGLGETPLS